MAFVTLCFPTTSALLMHAVALRTAHATGPVKMQYGAPAQQVTWLLCENQACFTLRNGEQQVLGRYDADHGVQTAYAQNDPSRLRVRDVPVNPYVSRQQCIVQVAMDGSATLCSLGKNPTGWRAHRGAPWQWLIKDQVLYLNDGFEVTLDVNHPDEAVFTCRRDGGGMGGYQQQQQQQQQRGYPPPQQGGYPPQQQGGYPPPQQGGYPPQQRGYPPPQQGGYPPQQQGVYPPQQGGYQRY